MPDVQSSMIRAVDHDGTQGLFITFTSGQTYVYDGVPRALNERFLLAPSKGAFFNDEIPGAFPFWRVTAPPVPRPVTDC